MEPKRIKLKVHHRNFSPEDLIANCEALAKEKLEVREGDLLEIFPVDDQNTSWRSHLILKVKALSPDIQSKGGPFSILQEVAVTFALTGLREVRVRRLDQREVALDLVELSFRDQYITRSDMWRITCSLLHRCLYSGQHLEHCTMRLQTHCLWFQGETVTSGAVTHTTRVVFRSLSAHVFLFIQISAEMWDFDPNGEFFFDKAVSGFLRELFLRWRESGCNHDVTIVFFWRLHYDPSHSKNLPERSSIHKDKKRGLFYEDFFKVIVDSGSNTDWSSELINIKKSFLKLKPLIKNLRGQADAELCRSEEGNILEAINLALNIMERQNLDTNLQLSGQQIVVLTAGTGYFEIDRKLMQVTNERLVFGGVTTDLVSMRDQPLHAMPMFKFHTRDEEFFSVPHWINYSYYSSSKGCGQRDFNPRIYLSDHLVNTYLQKDTLKASNASLYHPFSGAASTAVDPQLWTWVDTDRHDTAVFKLPNSRSRAKAHSSGRLTRETGGERGREVEGDGGSPSGRGPPVTFQFGDTDPFDGNASPSRGIYPSQISPSPREAHFTRSLAQPRQRYKSENFEEDGATERLGTSSTGTRRDRSNFTSVGSAEGLRQTAASPWDTFSHTGSSAVHSRQKKMLSFSNPFDPNKIHSEAPAFQRRWAHVFPTNKRGVAFQTHHETQSEEQLQSSERAPSPRKLGSSASTPQSFLRRKGILKNSAASSPVDASRGSLGRQKASPVTLSPQDTAKRVEKIDRGLLPAEGSSVSSKRESSGSEPGSRTHTPVSSRHTSATNTPDSHRRQRWTAPSLLSPTAENFASVRRTGVDWTSLVEPAHLPVTTDFYPAREILDRDYVQYNSSLVVFKDEQEGSEGGGGGGGSEKRTPVWHADHSTMTTLQAFQEMISQRLSQGFQLTRPPPSERTLHSTSHQLLGSSRDSNTVFLLHEALENLRRPRSERGAAAGRGHRPVDSVTIHMGLSHVFQKLVLAFQDISVFIYRQKSPLESHRWLYSYQLNCASETDTTFQKVSTHFTVSSDEYNWNYLDNHVCGYSDFEELGESLKYWELRYLLLPKTPLSLPPPVGEDGDRTRQEHETLISNFVRFLELLNHIKKTGRAGVGSRKTSSSSLSSAQTLNRHSSLPAKTTTPQRTKLHQRTSLPATLDPHMTPPGSSTHSTSPTPSPTPTPTHSATATPSRHRQLSEIEEEGVGEKGSETNSTSRKGARRGGDNSSRLGAGAQHKMAEGRTGARRQSVAELETIKKARSRENLLQVEQPESQSRPESPSTVLHRDFSRSPSLTPQPEDTRRDSPRTERRKIIGKLRKIALEDAATAKLDGDPAEKAKPVGVSGSTQRSERETDLESSLDYTARISAAEAVGMTEGETEKEEEDSEYVNIDTPLTTILTAMESETDGIDFLGTQPGLCKGCFVAMDAVKWVVENMKGVGTRRHAAKILQSMIKEQMVVHASRDPTVPFLDGYFFYCIPHKEEQPKDQLNSSYYIVNSDFDSFSRRWFETEIEHISTTSSTSSLPSCGEESPRYSPSPPSLASSFKTGQPYYMLCDQTEETYVPPSISNRRVELNPDPHYHGNRPEWCYVHYDAVYSPNRAFQLRFQWMVATTNLLGSLIQNWVRYASMCDFNLVPVPVKSNLHQDTDHSSSSSAHPFRRPSFIQLSLPADILERWREEGVVCVAERTRSLLLTIAAKNGFFPDSPSVTPEPSLLSPHFTDPSDQTSASFFVHHTGTALIQVVVEGAQPSDTASQSPSGHNGSMWPLSGHKHSHNSTSTPLQRSPAAKLKRPTSEEEEEEEEEEGTVASSNTASVAAPGDGDLTVQLAVSSSDREAKSGFYWHRNPLLPKQKNIAQGLVERQYSEVLHQLTRDCQNHDQVVETITKQLFT